MKEQVPDNKWKIIWGFFLRLRGNIFPVYFPCQQKKHKLKNKIETVLYNLEQLAQLR